MLKWIAITAMVIDHFSVLVTPLPFAHEIGRLAYPLFAFLIARNYGCYTSDQAGYILRLFTWGLLAQPVYMLAFGVPIYQLNVLFTLAAGAWIIAAIETRDRPYMLIIGGTLLMVAPWFEYGLVGLLLVPAWWNLVISIRDRGYHPLHALIPVMLTVWLNPYGWIPYALLGAALALFSMMELGAWLHARAWRGPARAFYAFYPLHLFAFTMLGLITRYLPGI